MINTDIKQITDRIRPRLMSSEYQAAELEELVKTHIAADIWLTWYADLTGIIQPADAMPGGSVMAPVTYDMAEVFHLSLQDLMQIGYENTRGQYTVQPMSAVLSVLCDCNMTECDEMLYVLTNTDSHYGAAAVLDPDIQRALRERFGSKCYLLPSSCHEMLCIAADGTKEQAHQLASLVHTINHDPAAMRPEDILSDHVFCIQDSSLAVVV